jgi:myo-inositol-1(or 4)-monophosphatase
MDYATVVYETAPHPSSLLRRRAVAEAVARDAAAILTRHRGRLTDVAYKGAVDLVTAADRESEAFVIAALAGAFPEDRIVGEEGGGAGPAEADFVWYVDPLDGTTNFVHGLPHFAVSLGAAYRGELVLGAIHAPALALPDAPRDPGVTWSAASGLGASRNGRPIAVSPTATLSRALVATGFPYDRQQFSVELAARVERALKTCLCLRRLGSASLDLAQVADGTFGAFWEPRLKPWDLAAGVPIVREAGGQVSDLEGGQSFLTSGNLLATNGHLHSAFLAEVLSG